MTAETPPRVAGDAVAGPAAGRGHRLVFIDALRGIAAVAVVFCHLPVSAGHDGIQRLVGLGGMQALHALRTGVDIFFVISGFVIVHSMREMVLNGRALGRFAVRRQLRLDPPYYVAVAGMLVLLALKGHVPGARHGGLPGLATVVANLLYVHRILGYPEIFSIAWTLCIEIQFYLAFALLMGACQWKRKVGAPRGLSIGVLALTGLASLWCSPNATEQTWMASYWCFFVAGALAWFTVYRHTPAWVLFAYCGAMVAADAGYHFGLPVLVGVAVALAVYGVGRAGRLATAGGGPVLQFFGRVSYSLYLLHWLLKPVTMDMGLHLTGQRPIWVVFWSAATVGLSIAAAQLMYVWVEAPSKRFASHFKGRPALARTAGGEAPAAGSGLTAVAAPVP